MPDNDRFEEGLRVRTEVLGAEHVERSMEGTSEFARLVQDFVTEYCWGAVWSRPGLGRRERSLINLAMLTALGRSHELGVHIRGAINNGCTQIEIQETLLQTCIYCGVPAAMEAFRVADGVLAELRSGGGVAPGDAAQTAGASPGSAAPDGGPE